MAYNVLFIVIEFLKSAHLSFCLDSGMQYNIIFNC